jgi:hypothetical protein
MKLFLMYVVYMSMQTALSIAASVFLLVFLPCTSVHTAEANADKYNFEGNAWGGIGNHRSTVRSLEEDTQAGMTTRSVRRRTLSERRSSRSGRDARKALLQHTPTTLHFFSAHVEMLDLPSRILLLGEHTPVIAGIKIFPDDEPVVLRTVIVRFSDNISSSVAAVEVVDGSGSVLGHIRLRLKKDNAGGGGGQEVKVTGISIVSDGVWTQRPRLAETERFDIPAHETALSAITRIERNGQERGVFTPGTGKRIASFDIAAELSRDADADPALETINFSVNYPSSKVTIQNIVLRGDGADTAHDCTLSSFVITCEDIPSFIGSLEAPRTLSLYANVSVTGTHRNPFLEVSINNPGRTNNTGDIIWTDGKTEMTWVPFN